MGGISRTTMRGISRTTMGGMSRVITLVLLSIIATAAAAQAEQESAWLTSDSGDTTLTCADTPCANGGICISYGAGYTCTCRPGYAGSRCDTPMPCLSTPCKNGGQCLNIDADNYQCNCPVNFVGSNCENSLPCNDNPCGTRGKCINLAINEYKCQCEANYYGDQCENFMPCHYKPCRNGGTCTNLDTENYKCACPTSKTGKTCEDDVSCRYANRTISGAVVNYYSSAASNERNWKLGAMAYCTCARGFASSRGCKVTCSSTGEWEYYSSRYRCNPGSCGSPPALEYGRYHYTNATYGSVANYTCQEGYELQGPTQVVCNQSGSSFRWGVAGGGSEGPRCERRKDCGPPPVVRKANQTEVNSTHAYGAATYGCMENYQMVGDGVARCMKVGTESVKSLTSGSYRYRVTYETVDKLKWVWVPSCHPVCSAREPETAGSNHLALLQMTVCRMNSNQNESPLLDNCDKPTVHGIHANQSKQGDRFTFRGDEVCVGYNYTYEKYTTGDSSMNYGRLHETKRSECRYFCLPGTRGYRRVLTRETHADSSSTSPQSAWVSRTYTKYSTFPVTGLSGHGDNGPYGGYGDYTGYY